MKHFNLINSHRYLYLQSIGEPEDNSVRIVIQAAELSSKQAQFDISESYKEKVRSIEPTRNSSVYEITFNSYVGYSVLDESFACASDEDILRGNLFCIYKDSEYLNYIKKCSIACEDYPGPIVHFGINCLNHIVDIVSIDNPLIKLLAQ